MGLLDYLVNQGRVAKQKATSMWDAVTSPAYWTKDAVLNRMATSIQP